MYVVSTRATRARREVHLQPRVHARPHGPAVHAALRRGRRHGPERPRGPLRARRGRRDPADEPLGPGAPHAGGAVAVARAVDPASQAVLAKMPAILKDPLLFPYTQRPPGHARRVRVGRLRGGRRAVPQPARLDRAAPPPGEAGRARGAGPGRVPRRPRGAAGRRLEGRAPGHVRREAAGASSSATAGAARPPTPRRAGAATGSPRRGPDGEIAVVLDTAWDTEADADQFEAALGRPSRSSRPRASRRGAPPRPSGSCWSPPIADTLGRVANVLGLAG